MENKENKKVVYLLGAGFSQAITNGKAPSTDGLGKELAEIFPRDIQEKYGFSDDNNIELFLTKIDTELLGYRIIDSVFGKEEVKDVKLSWDDVIKKLEHSVYIEESILSGVKVVQGRFKYNIRPIELSKERNGIFKEFSDSDFKKIFPVILRTQLRSCRLQVASEIDKIFKTSRLCDDSGSKQINIVERLFRKNDTVLTLNYDCLLENLLYMKGVWRERCGYGECLPGRKEGGFSGISIYKLHGSINFRLKEASPGNLDDISFQVDNDYFPDLKLNEKYCKTVFPRVEHLIYPSYIKQFNNKGMLQIWKEAISKVRQADVLVIMGCSMRREDYHLKLLVSQIRAEAKIFIIDHEPDKVKKRLQYILINNPGNIEPIKCDIGNPIELTEGQVKKIYEN